MTTTLRRQLAPFAGLALLLPLFEGCQCSESADSAAAPAPVSREQRAAPVRRESVPPAPRVAPEVQRREVAAPEPPPREVPPAAPALPEPEPAWPRDRALEETIVELEANEPQRRWQALEVLEERGDAAAARALGDFVLEVREENHAYDALDSLSAIATPESTAAIARVLDSRVPSETKIYALESLMDLETPEAAAAARRAFHDEDPEVRAEAIESMLWFDDRSAVGDLRDALAREPDPDVRDLIADVLEFYENTTPEEN